MLEVINGNTETRLCNKAKGRCEVKKINLLQIWQKTKPWGIKYKTGMNPIPVRTNKLSTCLEEILVNDDI